MNPDPQVIQKQAARQKRAWRTLLASRPIDLCTHFHVHSHLVVDEEGKKVDRRPHTVLSFGLHGNFTSGIRNICKAKAQQWKHESIQQLLESIDISVDVAYGLKTLEQAQTHAKSLKRKREKEEEWSEARKKLKLCEEEIISLENKIRLMEEEKMMQREQVDKLKQDLKCNETL